MKKTKDNTNVNNKLINISKKTFISVLVLLALLRITSIILTDVIPK